MKEIFGSKSSRGVTKEFHKLAICYIRHLRAFSFAVDSRLPDLISSLITLLLENKNESLNKLKLLEQALWIATERLDLKHKFDENLKDDVAFKDNVDQMRQKHA